MSMDFGNSQRKFACFVCGSVFIEYSDMKNHIIESHEEGREYVKCPLTHCGCPVRTLRDHFASRHPSMPIPKNCQLRASVWYDHSGRNKKKKFSFAEGNFVSEKNGGRSMHYRSGWELKVYELLEEMGEVLSYQVEPFKITYYFKGKPRTYIPDIMVNFADGSKCIYEIKPANQVSLPQIQAKKNAADYCIARGMTYRMITEGVIDKMKQDVKNRKLNNGSSENS